MTKKSKKKNDSNTPCIDGEVTMQFSNQFLQLYYNCVYRPSESKDITEAELVQKLARDADFSLDRYVDQSLLSNGNKEGGTYRCVVMKLQALALEVQNNQKLHSVKKLLDDIRDLKISSTIEDNSSKFAENMEKAGLNTLLGMGTVFVVLILISLIIGCFGFIPQLPLLLLLRLPQGGRLRLQR